MALHSESEALDDEEQSESGEEEEETETEGEEEVETSEDELERAMQEDGRIREDRERRSRAGTEAGGRQSGTPQCPLRKTSYVPTLTRASGAALLAVGGE